MPLIAPRWLGRDHGRQFRRKRRPSVRQAVQGARPLSPGAERYPEPASGVAALHRDPRSIRAKSRTHL